MSVVTGFSVSACKQVEVGEVFVAVDPRRSYLWEHAALYDIKQRAVRGWFSFRKGHAANVSLADALPVGKYFYVDVLSQSLLDCRNCARAFQVSNVYRVNHRHRYCDTQAKRSDVKDRG